ncbi:MULTISPECIES: hypothetical protein [Paenibacillus]|uniref:Uncharacterized protein n=1 Tax=Paenibacillus tundrae TaxID=528187 RepID=A0ABT9WDI7_9BACL|nr:MULTISPECIES: hypothetical protein [Paenibacillus]MDQ0171299.1 hypothetical protein [Paenibacillus tundrae]
MPYLDEEIAKIEKQRRQELREKKESKSHNQNLKEKPVMEQAPCPQEILEGVRSGVLLVEGVEVIFEKTSIMQTGISMMLPQDFVQTLEDSEHLVYSNEKLEMNLILQWVKPIRAMSMGEFKEIMKQQFQSIELAMNWMEDGDITPCDFQTKYCVFSSSVANGHIFNYQAFIEKDDHQLIFNVNGNLNRWSHWKPVVTGMLSSMEVTVS